MIRRRLLQKGVLVLLDDVDHVDQVNSVARRHDWFGSVSKIIITTKDEHILKKLEVDDIYKDTNLSDTASLELFSWHAFRSSYPDKAYFELSKTVVSYRGGLPLALEVLCSFLFGRTKLEWTGAMEKLTRIPHGEIQKKLRISLKP